MYQVQWALHALLRGSNREQHWAPPKNHQEELCALFLQHTVVNALVFRLSAAWFVLPLI